MARECIPCGHDIHQDGCWFCKAYNDFQFHRTRWDCVHVNIPAARMALPRCPNLGEYTGDAVECTTCSGNVHIKVYACSVYSKCTIGTRVANLACCEGPAIGIGCPGRPDEGK